MNSIISCTFNMDTICVELLLIDGTKISIDCQQVEDQMANDMYERSELDWLIYNAPVGYAELIFTGDLETYLKTVTRHRSFES